MRVSINTVKQLVGFELPPVEELVARINAQLGGVEQVIDLGAKYLDTYVVQVMSVESHPDADKLTVCLIDDGGVVQDVERNEQGYVQVVCGAPNVQAGMWTVWLPPKATVPSTYDDPTPFVLDARKLRGVMSNGMLAAGDELAISNDHDGIIEITEVDVPEAKQRAAGARFAEIFDLNDTIIDIENKMFTHRPDCFGQLGVAREIAGILGHQFESPDWYSLGPVFAKTNELQLEVFSDAGANVSRFMAVALQNVEVKQSPLWLQTTLMRWGSKAINNIVDITNYVMLLTAQPVHAYDYDKLRGHTLGARLAQEGEQITLLNGKTYSLSPEDIVIADAEGPVGLAGIMGSRDSEVDASTNIIVLEVASFDMYTLRKSAMRHGVFTDALTRFNKGQSSLQNDRIMHFLMDQITQLTESVQANSVADIITTKEAQPTVLNGIYQPAPIKTTAQFINERLGLSLNDQEVVEILSATEFTVQVADGGIAVSVPFWRTDVLMAEDVVEEVGRLYGFENIPRNLPLRLAKPAEKNAHRQTKQMVRSGLARAGANEVLTYSFVHKDTLKKADQDPTQAFKLASALSPELQYYRLSVLPSLLDKVYMNIRAGHEEFTLFEIGKGHNKKYHADDDAGLPTEMQFIDAVYASKHSHQGAPYYYMRHLVSQLAGDYGVELRFSPVEEPLDYPVVSPFDLTRSALVETSDGVFLGMVGELKQSVIRNFKLPQHVAAMTLDFEGVHTAFSQSRVTYRPLSRYPASTRDLSISVGENVPYNKLWLSVQEYLYGLQEEVQIEPVGVYQGEGSTTKSITFHVSVVSHQRTLESDEVNKIIADMSDILCRAVDGSVV